LVTCFVIDTGDGPGEMSDSLPYVDVGSWSPGAGVSRVLEISAGGAHTCAVLENDGVKCWGGNAMGQLGLEDSANRGDWPGEMGDALSFVSIVYLDII
jgi:alpha-tubulin suppressor-like RCC1 family protein